VFVLEVAIGAIACVGTIFVDLCLDRCWVCKVAGTYEGALFLHAEVTTLVIVFGPGRFLVRYVVLLNASISLRVRSLFAGNRAINAHQYVLA